MNIINAMKDTVLAHKKLALLTFLAACGLGVILSFVLHTRNAVEQDGAGYEIPMVDNSKFDRYPAAVRVAIVRMMKKGAAIEDIRFNAPDAFNALHDAKHGVFAKNGGGVTYQYADEKIMASGQAGAWYFNMNVAWPDIGTNAGDLVAYLPGIKVSVCQKINADLKIEGIPELRRPISQFYTHTIIDQRDNPYVVPERPRVRVSQPVFSKHLAGCFKNYGVDSYTYYNVLMER